MSYRLAPGITLNVTDDEALLLNLHAETMFSLNATGARIVELTVAGHDVTTVVAMLVERFQADPADVARDVRALLSKLESAALLVEHEPPVADT